MTPETLERLEEKIAYLERANTELSDVVYRQQQELNELRARVGRIVDQMETAAGQERPYTSEEEKPPHY
jgi:SlyX protein